MRDIIRNAFNFPHEPLELVEHVIYDRSKPVDVVVASTRWQSLGQVAVNDAPDRTSDSVDASPRSMPQRCGAEQSEYQHERAPRLHGLHKKLVEFAKVVHIPP
jgi:hypothetical protein